MEIVINPKAYITRPTSKANQTNGKLIRLIKSRSAEKARIKRIRRRCRDLRSGPFSMSPFSVVLRIYAIILLSHRLISFEGKSGVCPFFS